MYATYLLDETKNIYIIPNQRIWVSEKVTPLTYPLSFLSVY